MSINDRSRASEDAKSGNWSGVWGMAIGVASLVTAEFMPVSLLTPMAKGIGISEGLAGQTISATAIVAILTSIFLAYIIRDADRRRVMLGFTALMIVSSLIVASAKTFEMLILGRLFLGVALGGFWSMSTSIAMRLVASKDLPKAFAIIFGGVSAATVISGPLGSFLENLVGWRPVFIFCALFSVLAFIWQTATLPSLQAKGRAHVSLMFSVFSRKAVFTGMACVVLTFGGHMAFFTYMRPYMEVVAGTDANTFSGILLAFGVANFVGNSVSGVLISKSLRGTLGLITALMFMLVVILMVWAQHFWIAAVCASAWGFAFGFIPVGWSTWLTRTVTDETEAAGGLYVACIQLGLLLGAGVGGIILDVQGVSATVLFAGLIMFLSSVTIFSSQKRSAPQNL
jgi:predicted MFS family arabinose efflux permease